jgi:Mn2+/Fe2+ NRAMP family transporter
MSTPERGSTGVPFPPPYGARRADVQVSAGRARLFSAIGPGVLMAGAAIGGSHLVSSTQAGARYGWALLGLVLLVNLFKYPFFLFSQRYTAATGETLLHGFRRMGGPYLWAFFVLNLVNTFLNIAGVAMITASLSLNLGAERSGVPLAELTLMITALCALIILLGHYRVLDRIAKVVMVLLALSTLSALCIAWAQPIERMAGFTAESPWNLASLGFIVLLMGWMPAPIDVAAWPSLWMKAREKETGERITMPGAMLDFHLGYGVTVLLAVVFLALGALVIHGGGQEYSMASAAFASQLVRLYTDVIGSWAYWVIALAAFTAMFSTTLTCVDGYPRSLATCMALLVGNEDERLFRRFHLTWIVASVIATYVIVSFLLRNLGQMLQVAMVISFLTSPVFAYIYYRAICAPWVPVRYRPGPLMRTLSWAGIGFFIAFSGLFLWWFLLQN